MNASLHRQLARRKRRILRRIENRPGVERPEPMMTASNIHYEIGDRTRAIAPGGIGAIHLLARRIGLTGAIDAGLHLLKRHMPYHESDHVLNIAYNLLAGGQRLEHIEVRRNDEVYLDALGAERIPDPTTAGDYCRRLTEADVEWLMEVFNETRLRAWKEQSSPRTSSSGPAPPGSPSAPSGVVRPRDRGGHGRAPRPAPDRGGDRLGPAAGQGRRDRHRAESQRRQHPTIQAMAIRRQPEREGGRPRTAVPRNDFKIVQI